MLSPGNAAASQLRQPSTPRSAFLGKYVLVLLWTTLLLCGCSPAREMEALWVLLDMAAGAQPSHLKERTAAPLRKAIHLNWENRRQRADLYFPAYDRKTPLLLIPGAAEKGKDDPRLVAFATTLARAGFVILVPDLQSLRSLQVGPENIDQIADAFLWLTSRYGLAPEGEGGIAAFSYAAGPALLAALQPELRDRVRFIFAVGPYHDLPRVLLFFTTGYHRHGERWQHLEPNEYGKWVFVLSNADRLSDPQDRQLLTAMAERKKIDLKTPVSDLASKLGSEGQSVYRFITNKDRRHAYSLMNALPPGILQDIRALNLADKDLSAISAKLILVHGYDDTIIPYTESIHLANALPEGQAQLFLAGGLAHVDLKPGLISRWRLWRAVSALLKERDRAPQVKPFHIDKLSNSGVE